MQAEIKTESDLQQAVRVWAMEYNCVFMRNNSGVLKDYNGRPVRYGLMNESPKQNKLIKSSDLIGIQTVTITPDMVGQRIGIIVAAEIKEPGWNPEKKLDSHEIAQKNFIDFVRSKGGRAGFVNGFDSALELLKPL